MIGTDLTNARGAVRVCCALGCNVNKHVHGRSDICCMRRNPSHQRTQRKQCNAAARANYVILFALLNFFLSSLPSSLCPSIHPASQPSTPKARRQAGSRAGWPTTHPGALAQEVAVDSYRNRKLARVRHGCKTSERDPARSAQKESPGEEKFRLLHNGGWVTQSPFSFSRSLSLFTCFPL